jgi:hypothetical protein
MPRETFASDAWLLEGLTVSVPGWLDLQQERLRFTTPDEVVFEVPRSDITSITFPWYYFGGGMKLRAAGRSYRLSFVKPNGAEYPVARGLASHGNPAAALLLAASKMADIRTGRDAGRRWRQLLGGPRRLRGVAHPLDSTSS